MKKHYKAVFFDLDGTLADTDLMVVETMLQIFKEFRPTYKPTLKDLISFSGPPLKDSMRKYFPDNDIEVLVKRFRELSPTLYEAYVILFDGVKETLIELKKNNKKIAVITSKAHDATIYTLKLLGIFEYFDLLICVDDVKNPKPDPEGIYKALETLKLKKDDILYVGDTLTDYLVAQNCGVDSALVGWSLRGVPKDAKPNYVLKDFSSLKEIVNEK